MPKPPQLPQHGFQLIGNIPWISEKHVKNDVKNRRFSCKNRHFLDAKIRLQSFQNVTT